MADPLFPFAADAVALDAVFLCKEHLAHTRIAWLVEIVQEVEKGDQVAQFIVLKRRARDLRLLHLALHDPGVVPHPGGELEEGAFHRRAAQVRPDASAAAAHGMALNASLLDEERLAAEGVAHFAPDLSSHDAGGNADDDRQRGPTTRPNHVPPRPWPEDSSGLVP